MLPHYKKEAALRLKVAAGHLEGVRRMVEDDVYCVDLMKQLAAVQGTLEGVQRILLRNHLSSCVSEAINKGMGEQIIDELMGALKYDKSLIDGRGTLALEGVLAGEAGGTAAADCCAPAPQVADIVQRESSGTQSASGER